jgi:N-methylhydantoinase A
VTFRVGVDTGGTFTDFILMDDRDGSFRTHKTPSVPTDPAQSLLVGMGEIASEMGVEVGELVGETTLIVHGTTVATNAILTETGAKTALITTAGFRDALQMRRGMREETLNNKLAAPRPLAPRNLRFGVGERVTFRGEEHLALSDDDVYRAIADCRTEGIEAVAVCFLHSYANPEHERQAKKILEAELPDAFITTSHELLAQLRLYERVSTTVVNCYVGPLIRAYLDSLVEGLTKLGFGGDLLIMQSSGGVASPASARSRAGATLLSGPAAAPVAGAVYAESNGAESCLTIDMGGTSFDAALVPNGRPRMLHNGGWVSRHRVALPMLAIHTIGAGGGSIGWIDRSGILRMGPQSAGADPGPACYGAGGTNPTCTDANVLLGYVNPDNFLGGRIKLDRRAAEEAVRDHVAEPLGCDVMSAAAAMFDVINVNMTEGIREVSVDQGEDPRDFLLVVGGGAGPVHAGVIGHELGIPTILVPRDSAVFAAAGMLLADVRHDAVRAMPARLSEADLGSVSTIVDELEASLTGRMGEEGFTEDQVDLQPAADLRYKGQFHEITLPLSVAATPDASMIAASFDAEHERLYGWSTPGAEIELVNLRVAATATRPRPVRGAPVAPDRPGAPKPRSVYLPIQGRFDVVDVFDGLAMNVGQIVVGPAIIELPTTTILVPEVYELRVTELGDFLLTVQPLSA